MKQYSFDIWYEDDWYLARLYIGNEKVGMAQGKTREEIFDMVADAFKTVEEIKCSWYRRLIYKIFRV